MNAQTTVPTTDLMAEYKALRNLTAYHASCIETHWFSFPESQDEIWRAMEKVVGLQKPVLNKLKKLHATLMKAADRSTLASNSEIEKRPAEEEAQDQPELKKLKTEEAALSEAALSEALENLMQSESM